MEYCASITKDEVTREALIQTHLQRFTVSENQIIDHICKTIIFL